MTSTITTTTTTTTTTILYWVEEFINTDSPEKDRSYVLLKILRCFVTETFYSNVSCGVPTHFQGTID